MTNRNDNVTQVDGVEIMKTEAAYSLIARAEIDTQIATAKAFPRSIKQFIDKALSIATVTEDVAQSCAYALPRDGKTLEGPSVRLAEIVVGAYGNVRAGMRVIYNDGKKITAQGICHDLETNTCVTLEVSRRITYKDGRSYNEDMQVVAGNAACAIAFRNAVFKIIPTALIQDVYEKVKEVAKGTAETLPARRAKALDYLSWIKVSKERILLALDIKELEDIDLEKLAILRGMCTLIKNGESTADEVFPAPTPKTTGETLNKSTAEAIKKQQDKAAGKTGKAGKGANEATDGTPKIDVNQKVEPK